MLVIAQLVGSMNTNLKFELFSYYHYPTAFSSSFSPIVLASFFIVIISPN